VRAADDDGRIVLEPAPERAPLALAA
jgi:hypothetical protein